MATKTYTVKTPVNHDNTPYEPGASIELEQKDAAPLLQVGAIEPAPKEAAAKK